MVIISAIAPEGCDDDTQRVPYGSSSVCEDTGGDGQTGASEGTGGTGFWLVRLMDSEVFDGRAVTGVESPPSGPGSRVEGSERAVAADGGGLISVPGPPATTGLANGRPSPCCVIASFGS
jgi:hypothetical protein